MWPLQGPHVAAFARATARVYLYEAGTKIDTSSDVRVVVLRTLVHNGVVPDS